MNEEEVRKVALLSRLALSDAEVTQMKNDLEAILGFMETLNKLDTENVDPTYHAVEMQTPLRKDEVRPSIARSELLAQAPKSEAFAFAVPKVMEGE